MKIVKIGLMFLSLLLSIIFFILLIFQTTILFINNITTKEEIINYINSANIYNVKSSDLVSKKDITLEEAIKEELKENNLSSSVVDYIISNKSFTNFLGEFSYKYLNYIIKNETKPILKESDLLEILDIPTLEYYSSRTLTDSEKETFNNTIKDITSTINEKIRDRDKFISPNFDKFISFIYQKNINTYLIVGEFIIIFLLFIFTLSFYKPFSFLSFIFIFLGIILNILFIIGKLIINFTIKSNGTIEHIIKRIFNEIFLDVLKLGIIYIIIGIVLYTIYKVLKKILYKQEDVYLDVDDNINPLMKDHVLR